MHEGRTALITGASSGLKRTAAELLARDGAEVVLVARREALLETVAAGVRERGGKAWAIPWDLSQVETLGDLARKVKERAGRLDLLVNNAGREHFAPLQATPPRVVDELLQLNPASPLLLTRSLLGVLKDGSAVVFMASASALAGAPGLSVYAATKGALMALTRSLARELAPAGCGSTPWRRARCARTCWTACWRGWPPTRPPSWRRCTPWASVNPRTWRPPWLSWAGRRPGGPPGRCWWWTEG